MTDQNPGDARAEAEEILAQTPATLPLRRPVPVFVEAELTAETVASEPLPVENASPATGNALSDTMDESPAASIASDQAANGTIETQEAPIEAATAPPEAIPSLPVVEFSPLPGAPVQSSLTLELRTDTPGAEIRYALDAPDVGADGQIYNAASRIFLPKSASIAARTLVNGELGPLSTASFEIVQPAWQKIDPLDPNDPTPHEIGEQSALEGAWKLAAASVRGKLHAHRGFWREDSYAHGLANAADGTYSISIVSDGAGSANLSRVGSKLLCAVALEHLQSGLSAFSPLASDDKTLISRDLPPLRALLVEAASLALQKLREEAARREKALSDFSSTLLILVRREWNGSQLCAALMAGDGAIALWDDDQTLTFLGEADHGEQSGQTKFITTSGMEAELPARVKFSIRPDLHATLVMSDGIADDFFPEATRFPELVNQTLSLVEADFGKSGDKLLEWMRYDKKGSADDRALIICWRDAAQNEVEAKVVAPIAQVPSEQAPGAASVEAKAGEARPDGEQ